MAPSPAERFPTVLGLVAALNDTPGQATWQGFAPAPRRKEVPQVLTMEPESTPRRLRRRVIVAGVVATLMGAAFPMFWQAPNRGVPVSSPTRWSQSVPEPPADSGRREGPSQGSPDMSVPSPPEARSGLDSSVTRAPPGSGLARQATLPPPTPGPRARWGAARPASAPQLPTAAPKAELARLFVSSSPWGVLYIDGRVSGNTPQANLGLSPGPHSIRIVHDGYEPFERRMEIAPGEEVRLVGIVLEEVKR
jgi:hypothetical protein